MAWDFVSISAVSEASSGNLTLNAPASAAQGDLLIACIGYRDSAAFTPPVGAGWNLVATQQSSGDTDATSGIASGGMWYVVRGADNPSFAFTRTAGDVAEGYVLCYRGNHPSPYDTGNAATLGGLGEPALTGITTTSSEDLLVAMVASGDANDVGTFDAATSPSVASGDSTSANTVTEPTIDTWILRVNYTDTTGADIGVAIADGVKATPGATGNFSAVDETGTTRSVFIVGAFKLLLNVTPKKPRTSLRALKIKTWLIFPAAVKKAVTKARALISTVDVPAGATPDRWLSVGDDAWVNTDDDSWYGLRFVTVKKARLKAVSKKAPAVLGVAALIKAARTALRSAKDKAVLAIEGSTKAARTKIRNGIIPVSISFAGAVKTARTKLRAPVEKIPLAIALLQKAARTRIVAPVGKIALAMPAAVKAARSKIRTLISTTSTIGGNLDVTVKLARGKIRAVKAGAILKIGLIIKAARTKTRSAVRPVGLQFTRQVKIARTKTRAITGIVALHFTRGVKTARSKTRSLEANGILAIVALAKAGRAKIRTLISQSSVGAGLVVTVASARTVVRSTKAAAYFAYDFFKSTVDDAWVSLKDDEWWGFIVLSIKNARAKRRAKKAGSRESMSCGPKKCA